MHFLHAPAVGCLWLLLLSDAVLAEDGEYRRGERIRSSGWDAVDVEGVARFRRQLYITNATSPSSIPSRLAPETSQIASPTSLLSTVSLTLASESSVLPPSKVLSASTISSTIPSKESVLSSSPRGTSLASQEASPTPAEKSLPEFQNGTISTLSQSPTPSSFAVSTPSKSTATSGLDNDAISTPSASQISSISSNYTVGTPVLHLSSTFNEATVTLSISKPLSTSNDTNITPSVLEPSSTSSNATVVTPSVSKLSLISNDTIATPSVLKSSLTFSNVPIGSTIAPENPKQPLNATNSLVSDGAPGGKNVFFISFKASGSPIVIAPSGTSPSNGRISSFIYQKPVVAATGVYPKTPSLSPGVPLFLPTGVFPVIGNPKIKPSGSVPGPFIPFGFLGTAQLSRIKPTGEEGCTATVTVTSGRPLVVTTKFVTSTSNQTLTVTVNEPIPSGLGIPITGRLPAGTGFRIGAASPSGAARPLFPTADLSAVVTTVAVITTSTSTTIRPKPFCVAMAPGKIFEGGRLSRPGLNNVAEIPPGSANGAANGGLNSKHILSRPFLIRPGTGVVDLTPPDEGLSVQPQIVPVASLPQDVNAVDNVAQAEPQTLTATVTILKQSSVIVQKVPVPTFIGESAGKFFDDPQKEPALGSQPGNQPGASGNPQNGDSLSDVPPQEAGTQGGPVKDSPKGGSGNEVSNTGSTKGPNKSPNAAGGSNVGLKGAFVGGNGQSSNSRPNGVSNSGSSNQNSNGGPKGSANGGGSDGNQSPEGVSNGGGLNQKSNGNPNGLSNGGGSNQNSNGNPNVDANGGESNTGLKGAFIGGFGTGSSNGGGSNGGGSNGGGSNGGGSNGGGFNNGGINGGGSNSGGFNSAGSNIGGSNSGGSNSGGSNSGGSNSGGSNSGGSSSGGSNSGGSNSGVSDDGGFNGGGSNSGVSSSEGFNGGGSNGGASNGGEFTTGGFNGGSSNSGGVNSDGSTGGGFNGGGPSGGPSNGGGINGGNFVAGGSNIGGFAGGSSNSVSFNGGGSNRGFIQGSSNGGGVNGGGFNQGSSGNSDEAANGGGFVQGLKGAFIGNSNQGGSNDGGSNGNSFGGSAGESNNDFNGASGGVVNGKNPASNGGTFLPGSFGQPTPDTVATINNVPVILRPNNVVIGTQTFTPGASPTSIVYNGQTFGLDSTRLTSPQTTIAIPQAAGVANAAPALVTAGGQVFTVGSSGLEAPGLTVAIPRRPETSLFEYKGQTFKINPTQLIASDRFVAIPEATQPTQAPTFVFNGETFSVDGSRVIAPSTTLTIAPGENAVVYKGQTIIIQPSQIVGPSTTIPLANLNRGPITAPPSAITAAGLAFSLGPGAAIIGSRTFSFLPGQTPTTIVYQGTKISIGPNGIGFAGTTIPIPTPPPSPSIVTAGGLTFAVDQSQAVIGGRTFSIGPNSPPTTTVVNGRTISIGPQGVGVAGTTVPLPGGGNSALSTVTADGQIFVIGPSEAVIGGRTFSIGPGIAPTSTVIDGQTFNIGPNGVELAGTTVPLPNPTSASFSTVTAGGLTFVVNPSQAVIDGHTFAIGPDTPPITTVIDGQVVSIGPEGIGLATTTVALPSSPSGFTVLNEGDLTFSLSPSRAVIGGKTYTLVPGAVPITTTINGQAVTISPEGIEFAGTTAAIPTATTLAGASVVTIDGLTITIEPTDAVIAGKTYAIGVGAEPTTIVIGTETISLGPGGVGLPTTTLAPAPAGFTGAAGSGVAPYRRSKNGTLIATLLAGFVVLLLLF